MRKLDGDLSRAVRMPLFHGVPQHGATWAGPATLALWGTIAMVAVAAVSIGMHVSATPVSATPPSLVFFLGLTLSGGIAALLVALWRMHRLQTFGRLPLEVSPQPICPGTPFSLSVELKRPPAPGAQMVARLNCMKLEFRPYGHSFRVYGETIWSEEDPLRINIAPGRCTLQGGFDPPADLPASNLPDTMTQAFLDRNPDCHGWLLEVFDSSNRSPVRGVFRLEVFS